MESRLLCSKTGVAPLKGLTIPRLELLSARILAVLVDTVYRALEQQIKINCLGYWLDSKTALHWIFNNGQWKQWIQFRVSDIQKLELLVVAGDEDRVLARSLVSAKGEICNIN